MAAIVWIAVLLVLAGMAGWYIVVRRYMRPLWSDLAQREERGALGEERRRRIARAMTEGHVVDDPEDARVALEAYERSRRVIDLSWWLLGFVLLAGVGILILAIHSGSVFLYAICGVVGCSQALIATRAWRLGRRGDRWAAATRAFHAR